MANLNVNRDAMFTASAQLDAISDTASKIESGSLDRCGDRGVHDAAEQFENWIRGSAAIFAARLQHSGHEVRNAAEAFARVDAELQSKVQK